MEILCVLQFRAILPTRLGGCRVHYVRLVGLEDLGRLACEEASFANCFSNGKHGCCSRCPSCRRDRPVLLHVRLSTQLTSRGWSQYPVIPKLQPSVKAACGSRYKEQRSRTFLFSCSVDYQYLRILGDIDSLHPSAERGVAFLGCTVSNAFMWSRRSSGGCHANLLFDR